MRQRLRQLGTLLRRQEGISLIMAVGILGVLSLSGATLIQYSSANERSANYSQESGSAYDLAEAGINEMMAVLAKPENNALDGTLLPNTTRTYAAGTVEWWGTFDTITAVWSLTSIGRIKNPTGPSASQVYRKLTAKVPVTPSTAQPLNNPSWNYIMSTQVTGGECDMTVGNTVEIRTNLYVFGNLCLENQGKVLAGETHPTIAAVKGKVTQKSSQNTIGLSDQRISQVSIGNGCKWFTNAFVSPCRNEPTTPATTVFATNFSTAPATLVAPIADFETWYLNAAPGPYFPCSAVSGTPPTFDSPVAAAGSSRETKLSYKNNNLATQNLTPTASYSCRVAGGGELSWNYSTKTLTVSGTIYIDGDVKLESGSGTWTVQYNGQATIYVSGSLLIKNIKLCGGVSGTNCDFANWDPNTEMLVFAADGDNRQFDVPAGVSAHLKNAHLQGGVYATKKLQLDTTSKIDGPMVGSEVVIGQSVTTNDFPTITTVPAGMPGEPTVYAQPNPPQLYSG